MEFLIFFMTFIIMLVIMIVSFIVNCIRTILYKIKIHQLLESIETREDFLFMRYRDFINVVILIFKRKGMDVKVTPKCGEEENGLILDKRQFVELWKHNLGELVEIEGAKKLARCMRLNGIYRGMIVTLGDFKPNTRQYCHTYVIQCITGEQLVTMCKEVQRKRVVLENLTSVDKV
ncbi:MAG: restriction endonuclease [Clostridia bacterium]|nr:restriction endonuclease [Clostridia bacterium]